MTLQVFVMHVKDGDESASIGDVDLDRLQQAVAGVCRKNWENKDWEEWWDKNSSHGDYGEDARPVFPAMPDDDSEVLSMYFESDLAAGDYDKVRYGNAVDASLLPFEPADFEKVDFGNGMTLDTIEKLMDCKGYKFTTDRESGRWIATRFDGEAYLVEGAGEGHATRVEALISAYQMALKS